MILMRKCISLQFSDTVRLLKPLYCTSLNWDTKKNSLTLANSNRLQSVVMCTYIFNVNPFQPLQIKSAVAVEGLKGYIYIEAFKQQHVKQAIEDIGNLRLGKWQQQMVPIREMTDVMRVVKDTSGVKRGSWVRIKRGIFKDDVAQVNTCHVTIM